MSKEINYKLTVELFGVIDDEDQLKKLNSLSEEEKENYIIQEYKKGNYSGSSFTFVELLN